MLSRFHSATLVADAHALRALLDGGDALSERCRTIEQYQHETDAISRDLLLAIRRTFSTPFDRRRRSASSWRRC